MILYYIIKKQVRAIQIKIKSYIFTTGMKPAICMELLDIFYFPCKNNIFVWLIVLQLNTYKTMDNTAGVGRIMGYNELSDK